MRYLLIPLLLAFIAGCTAPTDDFVPTSSFAGGFDGLVVEFDEMGRTSDVGGVNEVWEDETFPVIVELTNKGEATIPAHTVKFEVRGIAPTDFSGISFVEDNNVELEPVFVDEMGSVNEIGFDQINFGDARYEALVGTHYDAQVQVQFTYPYTTTINMPTICYKGNIRDTTTCIADGIKPAFASGGPIQVGTVTEKIIGRGRIALEIPIKNVGNGKTKAFLNDVFKPEWDEVAFEVQQLEWECSSRGNPTVARINHPSGVRGDEEAVIRCVNNAVDPNAAFRKAVTLSIKYFYQDQVQQVVRIRKMPQ